MPPKLTAPEIVTKSPTTAPWLLSVTVKDASSSATLAKVIEFVLVFLTGVTSLKVSDSSMKYLLVVPTPRYFSPDKATQPCKALADPTIEFGLSFCQPPIFSTLPLRKRIRLPSTQPPSWL